MDIQQNQPKQLNGIEQQLHILLEKKDAALAKVYFGGLTAFYNRSNPEYIVHSAHSFRELMGMLPAHYDIKIIARKENLKTKVNDLLAYWENALTDNCDSNGNWLKPIGQKLEKFLKKAKDFFEWHKQHNMKRKEEAGNLLSKLNSPNRKLPKPILNLRVDEWDEIIKCFHNIAHHSNTMTEEEFTLWKNAFENFLLTHIEPQTFVDPKTFNDLDEIDAIILEGEKNA